MYAIIDVEFTRLSRKENTVTSMMFLKNIHAGPCSFFIMVFSWYGRDEFVQKSNSREKNDHFVIFKVEIISGLNQFASIDLFGDKILKFFND